MYSDQSNDWGGYGGDQQGGGYYYNNAGGGGAPGWQLEDTRHPTGRHPTADWKRPDTRHGRHPTADWKTPDSRREETRHPTWKTPDTRHPTIPHILPTTICNSKIINLFKLCVHVINNGKNCVCM